MLRKRPAPRDPGEAEIDAWEKWLRTGHEQRLLHEFPDTHLVAQERARVDAQITAIVKQMRYEYQMRQQR